MFRVSVRKMLILAAIGTLGSTIALWIRTAEIQRNQVRYVRSLDGVVLYDFQMDQEGQLSKRNYPKNIPAFLIDWLGPDYFCYVRSIKYHTDSQDTTFDFLKISALNHVHELDMSLENPKNSQVLRNFGNIRRLTFFCNTHEQENSSKTSDQAANSAYHFISHLNRLTHVRIPAETNFIHLLRHSKGLRSLVLGSQSDRNTFANEVSLPTNYFDRSNEQKKHAIAARPKLKRELKPGENAAVLAGLESLKKLWISEDSWQKLNMSEWEFEDILPKLTRLKVLSIPVSETFSVSCLRTCTELETLSLRNSSPKELQVLRRLSKLKKLDLTSCKISNLEAIGALTSLTHLKLTNCKVGNVGSLAGLTKLKALCLSYSDATGLGQIKGLINLEFLGVENVKISDYGFLAEMRQLKMLSICGQQKVLREIERHKSPSSSFVTINFPNAIFFDKEE